MSCKGCGGKPIKLEHKATDATEYEKVIGNSRSDAIAKARAKRYAMLHKKDIVTYVFAEPQQDRGGEWFVLIPFAQRKNL